MSLEAVRSVELERLGGAEKGWDHFTQIREALEGGSRVIVRGQASTQYDSNATELIDGLAGLFVVNVGHGCKEIAAAFRPMCGTSHTSACSTATPTCQ